MSAPSAVRIPVQVRQPASLHDLSSDLQLQSSTLAELNDVEAQHRFDRGDWVVRPSKQSSVTKQLAVLDACQLRRTPPQLMAPPPVQTTGVVRLGETLLQVAQRYGTTMQELVRLTLA
jgi:LysM repeat protein